MGFVNMKHDKHRFSILLFDKKSEMNAPHFVVYFCAPAAI